jgi:hypothetical protein
LPRLQVDHLQHALRNLTVTLAYRSYGSMIHFHFGDLYDREYGHRIYKQGMYYLMIEIAAWEINQHGRRLATNDTHSQEIERIITRFLGARVKAARFAHPDSVIEFSHGLKVAMWPNARLFGTWGLSNWTLFQGDDVALESAYRSHRLW